MYGVIVKLMAVHNYTMCGGGGWCVEHVTYRLAAALWERGDWWQEPRNGLSGTRGGGGGGQINN